MNRREALRAIVAGALTGGAAAGGAVALGASNALANPSISEQVNELFAVVLDARHEGDRLWNDWQAAFDRTPAWAKAGPKYMNSEGERVGHEAGWAEVAEPKASGHPNGRRLIRPSFNEAWELPPFVPSSGPERAPYLARRRQRVRGWIKRQREQAAEREKSGMLALEAAMEAQGERRYAAENAIRELNDRSGNADYLAAVLLGSLAAETYDTLYLHRPLLRALANVTTGCVAEEVARVLAMKDDA